MDPFLLVSSPVEERLKAQAIDIEEFAQIPSLQRMEGAGAVALALSGGPDSMALCALVHEWAATRDIRVHAVTVDHALRPESAEEAQRVGAWVGQYFPGVIHTIICRDPQTIPPTKIQEQAREDRYRLMTDYCRERGIKHLLLAHHRDDQAETFLFRLCKGSGLDGLAAMEPLAALDDITLLRPLLDFGKERLVATCYERGLPFVSDPSNKSDKFARVRLRDAMEALAREGLSPKRLAVTAARLARARDALDHYAQSAWSRAAMSQDGPELVFHLDVLKGEPEDIQVRVVMRALTAVGGDDGYGPGLERVEELTRMVFTESGFVRTTLHHCIIEKSEAKGTLTVRREIS